MFSVLKSCNTDDESDGDTNESNIKAPVQVKKLKKSDSKKMSVGEFLSSSTNTKLQTSVVVPFGFTEVTSNSHKNKREFNRNNSNGKYNNGKNFQYKNNKNQKIMSEKYKPYNSEKDQFKIINSKFPHLNKETKKNKKKLKSNQSTVNIGLWGSKPDFSKVDTNDTNVIEDETEKTIMKPLSIGMELSERKKESTFNFHRISSQNRNNYSTMNFNDMDDNYDRYMDYDNNNDDNYDDNYDDSHNNSFYDDDNYQSESSYDDYDDYHH